MRLKFLLYVLALFVAASVARAQELTKEESVAQAILDLTTTEHRHLLWQPCGERFRGHHPEALEYARSIAAPLVAAAEDDLDPWWMAAQLMQESGMNPCAFSSNEFAQLRRELGRRPTQRDVLHLLRNPEARRERGIRAMDGGLAQFRWPGTVARRVGIDSPEQLIDPGVSLRAFATALRLYRARCEEHPRFSGVDTVPNSRTGRSRVIRWSYSCDETFWAIHNSGSPDRVRRRYILNVRRRYTAGPERWKARFQSQEQPAG